MCLTQKVEDTKNKPRGPKVKDVAEKLNKPKPRKELSYQSARTLDELYELDKVIVIPDKFIRITQENEYKLKEMVDLIEKYKNISIDTETTGLDPFEDKITDLIVTINEDPTYAHNYHIPMLHVDREERLLQIQIPSDYIKNIIKPYLESDYIKKDYFNAYFDMMMFWGDWGIHCKGLGWDSWIAAHLLNENEPSHKLKDLYGKYLYEEEPDPQIKALGVETYEEQFGKIKFYRVPLNVATCYAAKDGYMTRRLKEFQKPYIDTVGRIREVFYDIEMPLVPVLINMRKTGINVDIAYSKKLKEELIKSQEVEENKLYEVLGNINLNSPKQLAKALFDDLGLPMIEERSTKASVLQELADQGYEVAENLINYKKTEKLISSFIEPIPTLVKRDGKVHCIFNQMGTVTGRFSSSGPNMQQIPEKNKSVRKMFTASKGNVLISTDYSQIEPRLLAHYAEDPTMIEAYNQGQDLYSAMAAKVFTLVAKELVHNLNIGRVRESCFNRSMYKALLDGGFVFKTDKWYYKELTPEDCYDGTLFRKLMKTLFLGIMYGMSSFGLAKRLNIDQEDADLILSSFFKMFGKIEEKISELRRFCKQNGYVETLWHRKRRLPHIWDPDKYVRRKADRQLLNSVIQGSGADLLKIAMKRVGTDTDIQKLGGRLLLTVHDELISEAPVETAITVAKQIINIMTHVCELKVPLKADCEIYYDGHWYGKSVKLKKKGDDWLLLHDDKPITEEEFIKLCQSNLTF